MAEGELGNVFVGVAASMEGSYTTLMAEANQAASHISTAMQHGVEQGIERAMVGSAAKFRRYGEESASQFSLGFQGMMRTGLGGGFDEGFAEMRRKFSGVGRGLAAEMRKEMQAEFQHNMLSDFERGVPEWSRALGGVGKQAAGQWRKDIAADMAGFQTPFEEMAAKWVVPLGGVGKQASSKWRKDIVDDMAAFQTPFEQMAAKWAGALGGVGKQASGQWVRDIQAAMAAGMRVPSFSEMAAGLPAQWSLIGKQSAAAMVEGWEPAAKAALGPGLARVLSQIPILNMFAPMLQKAGATHGEMYNKALAEESAKLGGKLIPTMDAIHANMAGQAAEAGALSGKLMTGAMAGGALVGLDIVVENFKKTLELVNNEVKAFAGVGKQAADTMMGAFTDVLAGKVPSAISAFNVLESGFRTLTDLPFNVLQTGIDQSIGHLPIVGKIATMGLNELRTAFGGVFAVFDEFKEVGGQFMQVLLDIGTKYTEMARTIAETQLDPENIERYGAAVRDIMASGAVVHFKDVADSIGRLGANIAGMDMSQLKELTTQFAYAEELVGHIDETKFAGILNAFDVGAEGASETLTHLVNIARETGISFNLMTDEMTRTGPAMRELGYNAEQTGTFFALMTQQGEKGTRLIYSMNEAVSKLQGLVAKGAETSVQGAWEHLLATIKELGYHSAASMALLEGAGISPSSAEVLLTALEKGTLKIANGMPVIQNINSSLSEAVDKTMTLGQAMETAGGQIEASLAPVGIHIGEALTKASGHVSDWIKDNQGKIANWGASFGAVFLKVMGDVARFMMDVFAALAPFLEGLKDLAVHVAQAILAPLRGMSKLIGDIFEGLGAGGMAQPFEDFAKGVDDLWPALQKINDFQLGKGIVDLTAKTHEFVQGDLPKFIQGLQDQAHGFDDVNKVAQALSTTVGGETKEAFRILRDEQGGVGTAEHPAMSLLGTPEQQEQFKQKLLAQNINLMTAGTSGMVTGVSFLGAPDSPEHKHAAEVWAKYITEAMALANKNKPMGIEVQAEKNGQKIDDPAKLFDTSTPVTVGVPTTATPLPGAGTGPPPGVAIQIGPTGHYGGAVGYQAGGVSGAWLPGRDSIPAVLEAGEYVINRNAVAQPGMRSHLDAINFGYQGGGPVAKAFALGLLKGAAKELGLDLPWIGKRQFGDLPVLPSYSPYSPVDTTSGSSVVASPYIQRQSGQTAGASGGVPVPIIRKPDGTYTSPDPAWAHLIQRESSGKYDVTQHGYVDVNTGGNEAYGLFQITPKTWAAHGGTGSVYNSTPEQQAIVAANIIRANPSGSDWGAGLAGRENAAALLAAVSGGKHLHFGGLLGFQPGGLVGGPFPEAPGDAGGDAPAPGEQGNIGYWYQGKWITGRDGKTPEQSGQGAGSGFAPPEYKGPSGTPPAAPPAPVGGAERMTHVPEAGGWVDGAGNVYADKAGKQPTGKKWHGAAAAPPAAPPASPPAAPPAAGPLPGAPPLGGQAPTPSGLPPAPGQSQAISSIDAWAQATAAQSRYHYGGFGAGNVYDCSGFMAAIWSQLTGKPLPPNAHFFTTLDDLTKFGFVPTTQHMPGTFEIGLNPAHMAGTLPSGQNVEAQGPEGTGLIYGVKAEGAWAPQFTKHYYLPTSAMTGTPGAVGPGGVPSFPGLPPELQLHIPSQQPILTGPQGPLTASMAQAFAGQPIPGVTPKGMADFAANSLQWQTQVQNDTNEMKKHADALATAQADVAALQPRYDQLAGEVQKTIDAMIATAVRDQHVSEEKARADAFIAIQTDQNYKDLKTITEKLEAAKKIVAEMPQTIEGEKTKLQEEMLKPPRPEMDQKYYSIAEQTGAGLVRGALQELGFPDVFGKFITSWGISKLAMSGLGIGLGYYEQYRAAKGGAFPGTGLAPGPTVGAAAAPSPETQALLGTLPAPGAGQPGAAPGAAAKPSNTQAEISQKEWDDNKLGLDSNYNTKYHQDPATGKYVLNPPPPPVAGGPGAPGAIPLPGQAPAVQPGFQPGAGPAIPGIPQPPMDVGGGPAGTPESPWPASLSSFYGAAGGGQQGSGQLYNMFQGLAPGWMSHPLARQPNEPSNLAGHMTASRRDDTQKFGQLQAGPTFNFHNNLNGLMGPKDRDATIQKGMMAGSRGASLGGPAMRMVNV